MPYKTPVKWLLEPATSCVNDYDATIQPTGHWPQYMIQWFIRFPEVAEFTEFPFHLGTTPMFFICMI